VTRLPKHPPQLSRAARRAAAAELSRAGDDAPHAAGGPRRSSGWWIVGVAILAAAAGAAWWATSGHSQAPARPMLGQGIPDEGFDHVAVGSQIHYKANPPVSGPHYPFPAPAGVYPNGLQTGFWVHSLEHGYIVLLYKPPVPPDRLAEFDRMVKEFPKSKYGNIKLLIVPYPDMPHPYAVLAWDWRLEMDSFDRATALQFYKEHVDHGREDIP
jgi:Protein of unknown function (DUF3105)